MRNQRELIVSSPLKLAGEEGVLVFEIWTKKGVMKKLLRNKGLAEKGGVLLERGASKLFHHFPLGKACFQYFFLSGKYSHLL